MKKILLMRNFLLCVLVFGFFVAKSQKNNFTFSNNLPNSTIANPASLQFSPDGRLYISRQEVNNNIHDFAKNEEFDNDNSPYKLFSYISDYRLSSIVPLWTVDDCSNACKICCRYKFSLPTLDDPVIVFLQQTGLYMHDGKLETEVGFGEPVRGMGLNMRYFICTLLLFSFSFSYSQKKHSDCKYCSGQLQINKLPDGAKFYLASNKHTIIGAAYEFNQYDTTYYVSSKIKNIRYNTTYNSKGDLESVHEFKDSKIIGVIIIAVIIILL